MTVWRLSAAVSRLADGRVMTDSDNTTWPLVHARRDLLVHMCRLKAVLNCSDSRSGESIFTPF